MPNCDADDKVEICSSAADPVFVSNVAGGAAGLTNAELRATAVPVDVADEAGTPTHTADVAVDATVGGVTVLAANGSRLSATIQNTGAANMRVTYDGTAPTATKGVQLGPGDVLLLRLPHIQRGAIKAIREGSVSTTAAVEETV